MKKIILAVSVLSFFAMPALAQETMAQAAERMKKTRKGSGKVITEDELKNNRAKGYAAASVDGATTPQPAASPAAGAAAASDAPKPKTDDEARAEKKAELEKKMKQWTDFVAETQKAMQTAQTELNDMGGATFGNRRAGLQKIIDEGTQHIAEAQQAIADLQEQARRAGIALR
jgi:DNA repair exonuclease SbcCD ATPase subunit